MSSPLWLWFRSWRRRLSRSHWAAGLLGIRRPPRRSHEPGLIMIQIDGLSRVQFERAMRRRRMPFLRRMTKRGEFSSAQGFAALRSWGWVRRAAAFSKVTSGRWDAGVDQAVEETGLGGGKALKR